MNYTIKNLVEIKQNHTRVLMNAKHQLSTMNDVRHPNFNDTKKELELNAEITHSQAKIDCIEDTLNMIKHITKADGVYVEVTGVSGCGTCSNY